SVIRINRCASLKGSARKRTASSTLNAAVLVPMARARERSAVRRNSGLRSNERADSRTARQVLVIPAIFGGRVSGAIHWRCRWSRGGGGSLLTCLEYSGLRGFADSLEGTHQVLYCVSSN